MSKSSADKMADLSLADAEVLANPNPFYKMLREQDPVHFDERLGLHMVSRYEDVQTVMRDPITFSQQKGWSQQFATGFFEELKAILERDGGGYFPEFVLLDPPAHTRMRRLLDHAFSPRRIKLLEPRIRALIVAWVEKIAARGEADGVNDFSIPLTIEIMCEQLGFPYAEAKDKMQKWARAYIEQVSGLQTHEEMLANAQLICELQHFIIAQIRERQVHRREDMISDLVYALLEDDQDAKLTFEETIAMTRGLLLAGLDTTSTAISNFLVLIATRPDVADQLYKVIDDDAEVARYVEELLRHSPPVRGLFRVTTSEVELGGKTLPEGAHVLMLFASANDDEHIFSLPRTFDQTRKNVIRHLSFGGGIHLCAGIALARMELRIMLQELLKHLKAIRLAVPLEQIRYFPSVPFVAPESLPLLFSKRD